MPNSSRSESNEYTPLSTSVESDLSRAIVCSRCCRSFMLSFSLSFFVIFLAIGLYYLLVLEEIKVFLSYTLLAATCLFAFIVLLKNRIEPMRYSRQRAPVRVPLSESLRTLFLSRSQSDGVLIDIPGHAESTLSLPVQIVISTEELGENAGLRTSRESTQNVEVGREEEPAGSTEKEADVQSSIGEELREATETLVKVVDETQHGKGSAVVAGEGSSELSAEARSAVLQGIRQRKQSPVETQKFVPLPEGEKTE